MFSTDVTGRSNGKTVERYRLAVLFVAFSLLVFAILQAFEQPDPDQAIITDDEIIQAIAARDGSDCSKTNNLIPVQSASHPPYGRELVFKMRRRDGTGTSDSRSTACKESGFRDIDSAHLAVREISVERSDLLIAFRPQDPEFARKSISVLRGLIGSLGRHQRVAVYLWSDRLLQIVDFTNDQHQLLDAISKLESEMPVEQPLTRSDFVNVARSILGETSDGQVSHQLIVGVVSDFEGEADLTNEGTEALGTADVIWTGKIAQEIGNASGYVLPWPGPGNAVFDLAKEVRIVAADRYFRTGYCAALSADADIDAAESGNAEGRKPVVCDARKIAMGRLRGNYSVDVLMSAEAQFIYEARKRLADLRFLKAFNRAKKAFSVRLRFDRESATVKANLNIRGKGTLSCNRKGFAVELSHQQRVQLFPNSNVNRFNLLSLCLDSAFIKYHLGASIFNSFGLFPLQVKHIEVLINGKSNGIYLATERPASMISRAAAPVGLLRRGYKIEARGPLETGQDAVREFQQLLEDLKSGSPQAREDAEIRLGLNRYLVWLAINSLLVNGDYVDELWLLATSARSAEATSDVYFSAFVWDFDALFTECHQLGRFAIKDKHGLLYCAESEIARIIASRPQLYERFVNTLENIAEILNNDAFEEFVRQSLDSIVPFTHNKELVAISYELDGRSKDGKVPTSMSTVVQSSAKEMIEEFSLRRDVLLKRINAYRSARITDL